MNSVKMATGCVACLLGCQWLPAQEPGTNDRPVNAGQLDEVVVVAGKAAVPGGTAEEGYRLDDTSVGPLGKLRFLDVPYSVSVTSGELIENRIAKNPTDALKTVPTVASLMSSAGYSSMHRVMIRGFNASDQNTLRNGLTNRSFTLPPMEDIERIEVMNGLSGFLYGFSAIGGSVNYVTKQPLADPFAAITGGVYENGIFFGQVDVGGPLYGDLLTSRLNLYAEEGGGYIDGSDRNRQLVSGAVRCSPFDGTDLDVRVYHQELDYTGLQTYFNITGINYRVPDAFDPAKQYGQPWTTNEATQSVVDAAIDSRLNDVFTFRGAFRYGDMERKYRFVGAQLTDLGGSYRETFVDSSGNDEWTTAAYGLVDAEFDTGSLEHKLTFGYTHWGFTFERGANFIAELGPSHVSSPRFYDVPGRAQGFDRRMRSTTHSFLIGDQIEITPRWSLLAGVNYAMLDNQLTGAYLSTPAAVSHIHQDAFTPTAAVVFKPAEDLSLYASYIQGLEQGGAAPGFAANAFEVLDPTVSDQFEIGAKTTLWDRFHLSTALFRIDKANQYVDPGDNVFKDDGRQVHQGVEVLASGRLLPDLTLIGGVTAFSAEVEAAADNPAAVGDTPVNVATRQAGLYLEYDLPFCQSLPGDLTFICGANFYGKRPVNIPNTGYVPSATTCDVGLRYCPVENLTFNLNVSNVFDKNYWSYYRNQGDGIAEDGLLLGDPRLFSASVKYRF